MANIHKFVSFLEKTNLHKYAFFEGVSYHFCDTCDIEFAKKNGAFALRERHEFTLAEVAHALACERKLKILFHIYDKAQQCVAEHADSLFKELVSSLSSKAYARFHAR